jgi:hypothetical protein
VGPGVCLDDREVEILNLPGMQLRSLGENKYLVIIRKLTMPRHQYVEHFDFHLVNFTFLRAVDVIGVGRCLTDRRAWKCMKRSTAEHLMSIPITKPLPCYLTIKIGPFNSCYHLTKSVQHNFLH